ncbi:MAG: hypothetical protein HeimC2_25440 [Candidatus Heimdallarchaeota archaeon LC_2]|nr:MAG: hypothetical protein HeimC2_25440 [Candidatus Heimdallarchaeota archaeon LC_2]
MSSENVFNNYMGAFIGSLVGGLLLLLFDFGGWYNNFQAFEIWEYYGVFYDPGAFVLIVGVSVALLFVAYGSYNATKEKPSDEELYRMYKISLTALIIIAVGGIVFSTSASENDDWWLDTGFYGGIIGSFISTMFLRNAKNATSNQMEF